MAGCAPKQNPAEEPQKEFPQGSFGHALNFLKQYHDDLIVLNSPDSQAMLVVTPAYQGRVMTSTARGLEGNSYGWVNYDLIASGEFEQHINVFGGEDRFWIGPEGGQFSVFFKEEAPFDFDNWFTPAAIDTEPWEMTEHTGQEARFTKDFTVTNYAGHSLALHIDRNIRLMGQEKVKERLGIDLPEKTGFVGFESENIMTNVGENAWTRETGMPSIWILGMYNPTEKTIIFAPIMQDTLDGKSVTDDYFGKVPEDRLSVTDDMVYFKADGKKRSKIGMPWGVATEFIASYSPEMNLLTIVQISLPAERQDYVNSLWKLQDDPFNGDVINSYNDGPLENGDQMGPFYELESSSPAAALPPAGSLTHIHSTFHFQGETESLNIICLKLFGKSIEELEIK